LRAQTCRELDVRRMLGELIVAAVWAYASRARDSTFEAARTMVKASNLEELSCWMRLYPHGDCTRTVTTQPHGQVMFSSVHCRPRSPCSRRKGACRET
jgi:hypothetical protein